MTIHTCQFCNHPLHQTFIDLGLSPLANSYLKKEDLGKPENFYPLHVRVCSACFLVQQPEFATPEKMFSDYFYFSSFSDTWLQHAKKYTQMMIERFGINQDWQIVEIASNDGYLLQYFKEKNIPILGIEPAVNIARVAEEKGIPTRTVFFGKHTAEALRAEGIEANLIIGNNVFAHVPHINDFVAGLKILLAPSGVITLEFPHLLCLINENQFDTIYQEHFSYFSLITLLKIFTKFQLAIFDVEELTSHGGSLRVFVKHESDASKPISARVDDLLKKEVSAGLGSVEAYKNFEPKIVKLKEDFLKFLRQVKAEGKRIVAYGAPAKGNTLLNYCGVTKDLLPFTVDRSPYKIDHYLPGTHLPIFHTDKIKEEKPDYLLILPWNLKDEIREQMSFIKDWGGQFVIAVPELKIFS